MRAPVLSLRALGRAVRDARRRGGLTQQALAEAAGVGQPTVSHLERGTSNVSFATLLRILAALGLELVLQERPAVEPADPWEGRGGP